MTTWTKIRFERPDRSAQALLPARYERFAACLGGTEDLG